MKFKTIFLILLGIWLIDFILTIIGIKIFGFYETNPTFRYFLGKGTFGLISFFSIKLLATYLFSILIFKMSYNKYNKSPNLTLFVFLSIFFIFYLYATINNVYLLI